MQGAALGEYIVTVSETQVLWKVGSKYIIDGFVGAGAYGQVVRAHMSEMPDRTVVIKRTTNAFSKVSIEASSCHGFCKRPYLMVFSSRHQSPSVGKRTLREVAIVRRLCHPNIVKARVV